MTETPQPEKDLVERLRSYGGDHTRCPTVWVGFLRHTADHIESLRAKLADAEGKIANMTVELRVASAAAKHNFEWGQQEQDRGEKAELRADHWEREFKYHNKAHGGEWEMRQRAEAAESRSSALEAEIVRMREALEWMREVWENYQKCNLNRSPHASDNGVYGNKSPWAELVDAIKRVLSQPLTTSLSDRKKAGKRIENGVIIYDSYEDYCSD